MGTSYTWQNPSGGLFNVGTNWMPAGVPGAPDSGTFDLGIASYTVSGDGTPGYLLIDTDTVTFTGSIEVSGTAGSFTALEIGGGGAAIFDGGTLYALSEVMVGDGNGDGALQFIDSAVGTLTATNAATALDIGFFGGANPSTGSVLVDNSTLTILGGAYVGVFSTGSLTITDDALVQLISTSAGFDSLEVGVNDTTVAGVLTVDDGATLNVGVNTAIGVNGNGTLEVAGNAAVTATDVIVADDAGSTGSIDVNAASLNLDGDLSTGAGTTTFTAENSGIVNAFANVTIGGGGGAALVELTNFGGLYAYNAGVTIAALGTLALDATAYLDSGEATPDGHTSGTLTLDGGTLVALDTVDSSQTVDVSIAVAGGSGAQPSAITGLAGSDLVINGGVTFQPGADADLLLGPAFDNGNTLYGFTSGDTLDVQITGTVYNSASYDTATDQLVLSNGSETFALDVADTGNYSAGSFTAVGDGQGGTDVTLTGTVYSWINAAGGSFTVPTNWNPTGVPGASDTAEFLIPGPYTVSGDGSAGYVLVQDAVTFTGSIEAAGLSGQFTALDVGDGGVATFGGGTLHALSEARIGDQNGSGTLAFTGGASGTLTATDAANALDIAFADTNGVTTSGTVLVAGAGTALTLLGGAYVGVDGAGTLAVSDHALVQLTATPVTYDGFEVGVEAGASGTVTVTGSATVSLAAVAIIGDDGHGSLEVTTGGTLDSTDTAGDSAGARLGAYGGADGYALIDGSVWNITGNLIVGDMGAGTLFVQEAGVVSVTGSVVSVGQDLGGNGVLTINGATLDTPNATLIVGPDIDGGSGASGGSGTLEVEGVAPGGHVSSSVGPFGNGIIAGLAGGTGSIDVQYNGLTFYGSLVTGAGTSIVTIEDAGGISVVGALQIGGGGGGPGQGVADFSIRDGGELSFFSGLTVAALGTLGIDEPSFLYNDGTQDITLDAGTLDALGSAGFGYDVTIHTGVQVTGGTTAAPSALIGTAGSDLTITGGITFAAAPAVLLLGAAYNPDNEINDFVAGDTLDLQGQVYNTASYDVSTQQLILSDVVDPLALNVADDGYSADSFSAYSDGHGGTDVSPGPPPCFLAGTRIATPDGERRVEDLRPGDRVTLADGRTAALIWVGERRLDPGRHPRPWEVQPIRICRAALAPGLPSRDLLVSPDHALLLDGVLVEARRLLNGRTIVQDTAAPALHYLHLELARHDVLLAEGVAAESYLDTGNRCNLHGVDAPATSVAALHPVFAAPAAARAAASCAPLATDPARVQPIWQRVAERAAVLGRPPATPPCTADAAPHLLVNGRRIAPLHAADGRLCFALPRNTRRVQLRSRAAPPTWQAPWLDDRRRLGLAVSRLRLHSEAARVDLALDGPLLGAGWWEVERCGSVAQRWTDGDASIALPEAADWLEVTAEPMDAYPLVKAPAASRSAARGELQAQPDPQ